MCAVWPAAGCSGTDHTPAYADDLPGVFVADAVKCPPFSHDSLHGRIRADPMSAHGIHLSFAGGNRLPLAGAASYGLAGFDNSFVITGGVPARFGDATGGIVIITTKPFSSCR